MKTFIILFFLIFLPVQIIQFEKFINLIPSNWSYVTDGNFLTITRKDSIEIKYCGLSPLRNQPVNKMPYIITIESSERLSDFEMKRRKSLQDSILIEYEKKYKAQFSKRNFCLLEAFKHNRNKIDTLRVPFYSDEKYSYFIKNNFPNAFCIFNDSISKEINDFERIIYDYK